MSIKSIKIKNLLSFDELIINKFEDINCIVGINNAGKSNLLKLLRFFYNKLDGKRELPPKLNQNYSSFGTITIVYDTSRIKKIKYKDIFKDEDNLTTEWIGIGNDKSESIFELTLKIDSNNSSEWSIKNKKVLNTISYLYPFFEIEARHIDLYNWDKLWHLVSKLKSFNLKKLEKSFFDKEKLEKDVIQKEYMSYISKIKSTIETSDYTYKDKVLTYIKIGLQGDKFLIDNQDLEIQSDGTNAHKYIETSLKLLITLTRREYITPIIYVDEPEIGLHPKRSEELILSIYETYIKDKTKTPYPTIIFATHSPNIVKQVIKLFNMNQQILHFSKNKNDNTIVQKMNSIYKDVRFLNIFSDNEARLFFSNFILFVEGETELEIFSNQKLLERFYVERNGKKDYFLKSIDVYATNEVILKYMKPSYSNTAIPYLILYDADKLIDIDLENKMMNFKSEVLSFQSLKKLYQKSYFDSKKYNIWQTIKNLFDWNQKFKLEFVNNIYIKNLKYTQFITAVNHALLNERKYFLNKTTIEEVLINDKSLVLFKLWFKNEFITSLKISNNGKKNNDGKTIKTIQYMMKQYPKKMGLTEVFNIIYKVDNHYIHEIPEEEKKFTENIKMRYFKYIMDCIERDFRTDEDVLTLFLLMFNGKTETLISRENKIY